MLYKDSYILRAVCSITIEVLWRIFTSRRER